MKLAILGATGSVGRTLSCRRSTLTTRRARRRRRDERRLCESRRRPQRRRPQHARPREGLIGQRPRACNLECDHRDGRGRRRPARRAKAFAGPSMTTACLSAAQAGYGERHRPAATGRSRRRPCKGPRRRRRRRQLAGVALIGDRLGAGLRRPLALAPRGRRPQP
jgi:hypothetical protein